MDRYYNICCSIPTYTKRCFPTFHIFLVFTILTIVTIVPILDIEPIINIETNKHIFKYLQIEKIMERDTFMSPEEALKMGLLDEVVSQRPDPDSDS